jgi:hypothetical protein
MPKPPEEVLSTYKLRQVLFCRLKARLVSYAATKGYLLCESEGCLMAQRKSRLGIPFEDGVHMRGSVHYERMATDFVLYDGTTGEPVVNSADSRWVDLGTFWGQLDTLCRWGGHFVKPDGGHFSMTWNGKS